MTAADASLPRRDARRSAADAPAAAAAPACAHCRLPVPAGLVVDGAERQFCCDGCRTVYDVIHGCGLERYYELRDRDDDAEAARAAVSGRDFAAFDDDAFTNLHVVERPDGTRSCELYLEGVHCAACVWLVERLPIVVEGVHEARLDYGRHVVSLVWDPAAIELSAIAARLDRLGYSPHPARGRAMRALRTRDDRRALVRIAVSGAIAGNVMMLAFALWGGAFHGIDPAYESLFRWVSLGLTAISLAWPGRVFITGALSALRAGVVHMDVPVAVGLLAGFSWSAAATVRGGHEVWFDSVSILVFLLLCGRWIQARQQRRGHDAVELLFSLTPRTARRVAADGARVEEVPVEGLVGGELVEVRTGDVVPADGLVTDRPAELDEAMLTGESRPVSRAVGGEVHAGTTNVGPVFRMLVERTGEHTRAGELMRLVERSASSRPPIVRMADRVAARFVVVVLLLAAGTAAAWWHVSPDRAVANAVSLLVVTCPCALGLATPLAIIAAIGRAAGRGILVKGGEVIERLATPGTVVLDKTGTITEGRLAVVRTHGDASVLPLAAAIERASAHPIARAIAALADDESASPAVASATVDETIGRGIRGTIDGADVRVGSRAYMLDCGIDLPGDLARAAERGAHEGRTPVWIATEGTARAVLELGDPIRPEAAAAIRDLERTGHVVHILSGDDPRVVQAVGTALGLPPERCRGGRTPEDKLRFIESLDDRERSVMVGDGVNDAAALAAAGTGIAVHGGAEASLSAADVYLSRPGISGVPETLGGARRTVGVIRRNLAVSLGYNVVGTALAMAGLMDPVAAAILMPLSSLTVISLSYRSRTFGGRP